MAAISKVNLSLPLQQATIRVQSAAKDMCPVRTGHLMNSISRVSINGNDYSKGGKVFTTVEYAPHVEYGTVYQQAANGGRGFLHPALEDNREAIAKSIILYIKQQIRKEKK